MSNQLDQFKNVFFEECADLLGAAEHHLSRLSDGEFDPEDIHAIFRAVHSVKGGAGTFGFDQLVSFAHIFETALDLLRSDENIDITTQLVDMLLRANDILGAIIQNVQSGSKETPQQQDFVLEQLEKFISENKSDFKPSTKSASSQVSQAENESLSYHISFKPKIDLMRFGNEPYFILRELKKISEPGSYTAKIDLSNLPSIDSYNPENTYISWEIDLKSSVGEKRINECFEFVEDDCELTIQLIEANTIQEKKDSSKESVSEDKAKLSKSPTKEAQKENAGPQETVHTIRVELDRIDRLVNTVGEMVIKQAMLRDQAQLIQQSNEGGGNLSGFIKALEELAQHTRELQESVMAIRAQPVKAVFSRMPRLVRELSTQLGKEVRIEMAGENTEIDKTVIERLGEPLTHMIRNAVDHGIELPEERIQKGKPAFGTVHLTAAHQSGRIVIQLKDDGKGITRDKVLKKAKEQGIVTDEMQLSGEEIDQLIFHPGFSTASQITNISGRGVGMDVVKKSIQALGGRISIQSVEGHGCTFNLMLPLTLAVLDGMIVRVGEETYVVPLISIVETIRPTANQIYPLVGGGHILDLRQKNIPLIYLYEIFQIPGATRNPVDSIIVVVETEGGEHIGLVVDELLSQQQVVLKSLEDNYDPIPGISAATILGNGRVSLILDVNALKSIKTESKEHHNARASASY